MFSTNRVKGKIALITGATSGIGKSCAIALAKLGMNLIVTGRRENLLIELKKELEEKFSVQVLAIQLDVKNADEVKDKLSSL